MVIARYALLLVALSSLPALACSPIMSAGFHAVILAYFVWLVLSVILRRSHSFCDRDFGLYTVATPIGCVWFAVPMILFALPFAFVFLAFPMHLAVEFFMALFGRANERKDRAVRLFYYGVPLAIALFGGLVAKWMLYSEMGGWRAFLVNFSANAPTIGSLSFLIGIFILFEATRRERRLSAERLARMAEQPIADPEDR